MTVHRSAFVPPPKVTSAVVHIVPADDAGGRRPECARTADRSRVRPAPQDAALEPEGIARRARCAGEARHRQLERRAETLSVDEFVARSRADGRSRLSCSSERRGGLAEATVGPARDRRRQLRELRAAAWRTASAAWPDSPWPAATRPARPSPRPGRRSRRGRSARAAAPCWSGGSPGRTASACSATRASAMKAARLRGSTASAVSSASSASTNLPAASSVSPCFSKLDRLRRDLVVGPLADYRSGMAEAAQRRRSKRAGKRRIHHLQSVAPALAWPNQPRDEKAVGAVVRRGQEPSGAVRTPGVDWRFLHNPR